MKKETLKVFVYEIIEIGDEKKKEYPIIESPYYKVERYSNVLESLFADINHYALPPTSKYQFNLTENQYA